MSDTNLEAVTYFNCKCPVVIEGKSAEISWSCKGVDNLKLQYFDGMEFQSFDSSKKQLKLNDQKIFRQLFDSTTFTLTSNADGQIVSQQQIFIQVIMGDIQTSEGESLEAFIASQVLTKVPLDAIVKEACYRFLLDSTSTDDLLTVFVHLKDQGFDTWDLFTLFVDSIKPAYSSLLALYSNCHSFTSSFNLYSEKDFLEYIQSLNQEAMIAQAKQSGHMAHKDALCFNVIEPVLMKFPANDLEYWYYCCCKALKGLGVGESDVSYCMCKLFKLKAWQYGIRYGSLLTLIFNEENLANIVVSINPKAGQNKTEFKVNEPKEEPSKEPLPKENPLEKPLLLKDMIISLGVEEVIASREKLLLADFQVSMYEKIFAPLVAHCPCNKEEDLEFWLKGVAVELKAVKIGQATASYCVARYISDKGWGFSLDLSEALIDLYQTETAGVST